MADTQTVLFKKIEHAHNIIMNEQIKKQLIRYLYQLKFIINDSYPDDDDFWNNYSEEVNDVYNKLEEIEKLINDHA